MYDRIEEARMRLSNTLIRYAGNPAYVRQVYLNNDFARTLVEVDDDGDFDTEEADHIKVPASEIHVELTQVGREHLTVRMDDPLIDITPVPLGFTAIGLGFCNPAYLSRGNDRQYKQGLCERVLDIQYVSEGSDRNRIDLELYGMVMANTVLGKYPTLPETLNFLENTITDEQYARQQVFPFHRDYALSVNGFNQLYLWHRTDRIATSTDGVVFNTLDAFNHLKEDLEDATNGVLKIAPHAS